MSMPQHSAGTSAGARNGPPRVLLVSSGGGHWIEMSRLLPAFEGSRVAIATTDPAVADIGYGAERHYRIRDFSKDSWWRLPAAFVHLFCIVIASRASCVVTTGAAPGLVAIVAARLLRRRTLWIDSIANAARLSLSGRMAVHVSDATVSQWEHLAGQGHAGVEYWGSVL
jgi:UDP-N-acetylglucosamine:LPS N-acetylglucosamine transferase